MRIPFGTITLTRTAKDLVMDCLDRGRVSGGTLVRRFEEKAASLIGVKETVAVSSGTDADTLALAVLHDFGAKRGDEVILPALSYVSTGHAVIHAGFTPVFVDIDPETLNIDVSRIEKAVTPKTRAIFAVHLMGKPADMDAIRDIGDRHGLAVIEDAAEAWGASYKGKNAGALGDMGAFSLYVAHIITTGDGGLVATDNEEYAEVLRSLRGHGRACACKTCVSTVSGGKCAKRFADPAVGDRRFHFQRIGYSSRMNDMEAALGLGTSELYDEIIAVRHRNLSACIQGFERFGEFFRTFREEAHERIGPHAFPFVIESGAPFTRDALLIHLTENGIDPRTLFTSIPTQCGGFEFLGHSLGDFPHSEHVGSNGLHIGVHQDITLDDVAYFIDVVDDFIRRY
ncbi:MAG: DegT/DnrJ/EryC1/StrS family aminotransferase [Desulfovibrio sp.]|nr:DegT/DnrJ/EryC1/StrS family aminotransferase [Desulfovibrio sp.]